MYRGGDVCGDCEDTVFTPSIPAVPAEPSEADKARPRPRRGPQPGTVRRPDVRARIAATKRLVALHRPDYDRLFAEEMGREP